MGPSIIPRTGYPIHITIGGAQDQGWRACHPPCTCRTCPPCGDHATLFR